MDDGLDGRRGWDGRTAPAQHKSESGGSGQWVLRLRTNDEMCAPSLAAARDEGRWYGWSRGGCVTERRGLIAQA